jgi:hypothetical protein
LPLTGCDTRTVVAVSAVVEPESGVPLTTTQSPVATCPVTDSVNFVLAVNVTVVWAVRLWTSRLLPLAAAIVPLVPGKVPPNPPPPEPDPPAVELLFAAGVVDTDADDAEPQAASVTSATGIVHTRRAVRRLRQPAVGRSDRVNIACALLGALGRVG